MIETKFNMSGGSVTIDLVQLNKVLAGAVADAQENLHQELKDIRGCLSDASMAKYKGDDHENYRRLCNANTKRENLLKKAERLSDAIHAHFHVNEACKRAECKIIK